MKRISLVQFARQGWRTGRDMGKALAESVKPGDTVDCAGFKSVTNSLVDEFVLNFIKKHSLSELRCVKFENASPLFIALLRRAERRRVENEEIGELKTKGGRLVCTA